MIILPAIDLKDGCCVRLYQGDFNQVTEYSNNPVNLARKIAGMGFDSLHVVDLDGAREGSQQNQVSVQAIVRASAMSIQLGGGIRDTATLERWFDAGVAKCVLGSVAVTHPERVINWIEKFSADRIVLALDVKLDASGTAKLATQGWTRTTDMNLWDCVDRYLQHGLLHVLCTDIGRDGALSGPNLELYREFVRRYPSLHLQASGGVRNIEDIIATAQTGAAAAITGRALLDGRISQQDINSFQQNA